MESLFAKGLLLHGLKVSSKHKVVSPRASASTPGSAKDGPIGLGHFASHGQGQTTRGGLRVFKIVVLGDGGVGKSALTLQFVSHSFLDYHDPTIEDAYQQQAVIDGEAALLDILDTAGQVEFTAMRDQYMRCGEGFIICYSVTDRRSFQEAVEYRKLISRVRATDDIPLVLVGNKFDLCKQRKVSTEEGEALAKQLGCPFFETSAALRHFVDDAFHALVKEIRARERNQMGNGSAKLEKQSKWRRFRNIFSVVFRKKEEEVDYPN